MPIPPADGHGFLPAGFHDCTLAEIRETFCFSTHRSKLCEFLSLYCQEWLAAGFRLPMFVDGGFSTFKRDEPKDIDVIVDISTLDLREPLVIAAVSRLLDHDSVLAKYGIEVFPYHPVLVKNDFRAFFSYVKPIVRNALGLADGFRKGMLRIQP